MLIVEDGTGKSDAESYVSVAGFTEYADKIGFSYAAYEDSADSPLIEQALRRSAMWLDATYGPSFLGTRTNIGQALEWPRTGVFYRDTELGDDVIPTALCNAQCEATIRELVSSGSLSPDSAGGGVKRDKVGDVETEFFSATAKKEYPVIDGLLRGLTSGKAFAYYGRAARG